MNPYSTSKVVYHPEAVEAFKNHTSHNLNPIFVQLMPQNLCNQSCHFCSYRLKDWKNSQIFDETKAIPWPIMEQVISDLVEMDVKAVEITGGGEPLAYKHIKDLLKLLATTDIETSLVTNATLLTQEVCDLLYATKFKWGRVSIDSGCVETYTKIRQSSLNHWRKAWAGIMRLVAGLNQSEQVIGSGYVVTEENFEEVLKFCRLAKDAGVSSVRVSVAFTPKGSAIVTKEQAGAVEMQIDAAKQELEDDTFQIANLFGERLANMHLSPTQDYDYCGSKDLLCVIEGECKVFTCCTLTGDPRGLMGIITPEYTFRNLWLKNSRWRQRFDVRKRCKCACLYERRNFTMLQLRQTPTHVNFI